MIFPKEKGEFIFQSQMDEPKPFGGDQDLRTSTLVRHRPNQGESNVDFLGESEFVRFVDRFHSVYSFRRETSRRICMCFGRRLTDEKSANIQARSFLSRTLDVIGKKCPAEGEAKVVT